MKRRLLNLLTALSLVLCIATSVLWARSYNILYALKRTRVDRRTGGVRVDQCFLASGRLRMSASRFHGDPDLWPAGWRLYRDPYYYAFRSDSPGTWLASWNAERCKDLTGGDGHDALGHREPARGRRARRGRAGRLARAPPPTAKSSQKGPV